MAPRRRPQRRPRRRTRTATAAASFRSSVQSRKKFYTPQRAQPWKESRPEPGVRSRRRVLRSNVDLVKLGGVGRAFDIAQVRESVKRMKFRRGSVKSVRIRMRATDRKGRRIRERDTVIESAIDKGRPRVQLADVAFERVKQQVSSFGWKVSLQARRSRKAKGEAVRSVKIDIEIVERSE